MGILLDFATRARLTPVGTVSEARQEELEKIATEVLAQELTANAGFIQGAIHQETANALKFTEDLLEDIRGGKVRSILAFCKFGPNWLPRWVNLNDDPTELLKAIEPIYRGAKVASAIQEKRKEEQDARDPNQS